jgi:hypothetical protein
MYLNRYHDVTISDSGVWRILKRLDLSRLPASQRYKRLDRRYQRYEKQLPGHQVQIDVKFIAPVPGAKARKYYQFTAIDDCTRLRVLRIYPRLNQRRPSSSSTTSSSGSPSSCSWSRRTTAQSSARRSTTTCSTRASGTATSSPARPA